MEDLIEAVTQLEGVIAGILCRMNPEVGRSVMVPLSQARAAIARAQEKHARTATQEEVREEDRSTLDLDLEPGDAEGPSDRIAALSDAADRSSPDNVS